MNSRVAAREVVNAILKEMQDGPAWDHYDSALDANDITLASIKERLITVTTNILEDRVISVLQFPCVGEVMKRQVFEIKAGYTSIATQVNIDEDTLVYVNGLLRAPGIDYNVSQEAEEQMFLDLRNGDVVQLINLD